MAEAEVTYIITEKKSHEADFETVIAAVGAYQADLPDHIVPEAFPSENERLNIGTISIVQTIRDGVYHGHALELAEQMKRGIERHIPEERREKISQYFAGTSVHGDTSGIE